MAKNPKHLSDISKMTPEERARYKRELRAQIEAGKTTVRQNIHTVVGSVVTGILGGILLTVTAASVKSHRENLSFNDAFDKIGETKVAPLATTLLAIASAFRLQRKARNENDQSNSIKLAHIERLEREENDRLERKVSEMLDKRSTQSKVNKTLSKREARTALERTKQQAENTSPAHSLA